MKRAIIDITRFLIYQLLFRTKTLKKNKEKKLLLLIFLIRTIAIFLARGNLINVGVAHIQRAVVILLNCNILYQCVFVVSFL